MKKLLVMLMMMAGVGLGVITPQEIIYDNFESGSGTGNWSMYGGTSTWTITTTEALNGSWGAFATKTVDEATMYTSAKFNTSGYTNIRVTFYVDTVGLDANEYFSFRWWNGTGWNYTLTQEDISAQTFIYDLPASADNNPNFQLCFACLSGGVNEDCHLDDVRIIGTMMPGVINVTYQTPLNGSSTIYDQNATFNVTVNFTCVGGQCGDVNATLKYNATASYPNWDVSNVTGATPFYASSPNLMPIHTSNYSASATWSNPTYVYDNNFNDTSTGSYYYNTGGGRLNLTFTGLNATSTIFYTLSKVSGGLSAPQIQFWNWDTPGWTQMNTFIANFGPTTFSHVATSSFIKNGVLVFSIKNDGTGTAQEMYLYDVYALGSKNPGCYMMLKDSSCSVTWLVNATRNTGNYWLNVTFNQETGAQNSTSPNFQINTTAVAPDTTAPNIASFKFNVSNMTNYSSVQGYQFNATITDPNLDKVWIEHNFSGTLKNYSATGNVGSEYYYNNASLAAGFYYIKWYANDTGGYLNNTDWVHYYQVNKSYLPISLYINGTNGDKTLNNYSNANFTANFSSGNSFNITLYTNLTGTMVLWDNRASPLTNYTALNPYRARTYLIIANFSNQNYTYSQANHTLTLQTGTGWLNVSYQSPATGNSQNVTQYSTFNVTMNVTCVGGICGNVAGVLRYNSSAGLNPNMNVSTIVGATPFYVRASYLEANISDVPDSVWSVAIGDANNDGKNEVVVGINIGTNELRMYENKSGGWVETNISDVPNYVLAVAIGDANNDGKNEVVVGIGSTTNEVRMYENKTGTWVETNISDAPGIVYAVAIGDANNDGSNEIVIGMASTTNEVRMYNYTGGSWVETNISDVPDFVFSLKIGDANNDGRNEVVIVTWATTNELRMYENKSGGWVETNISNTPVYAYGVAIGDADNDGLNETVVVMSSTTNEVRMYKNVSGGWRETNISDVPVSAYAVAIGDVDNNGDNGVATGMWSTTNEVRTYVNKTGTWVETNISNVPVDVYAIAVGDANNKGGQDIVIGMLSTTNEVRMYEVLSNPFSCGALSSGQTCTVSWTVNAIGTIGTQYWLDVNFTSNNANVPANDSGNFQINITGVPTQYGWLNVSYQSPATGSNQNLNQNGTFNVTMNVTCVSGICGNVTGVLRYNSSAGLNPDTNVSMVTGATPFYMPSVRRIDVASQATQLNAVAIGDADNDGIMNFVVAGWPYCVKACLDEISIYTKSGGVWEGETIDWLSATYNSVAIGDANNNGKNEVVIGASAGINEARMYVNETGLWKMYNLSGIVGDYVYSVAIGDADNDGLNETVAGAGYSATNEVRMYKNASGTWIETNISEVGEDVWSVAIGDADNDGYNEVVIGAGGTITNEVRMYKNASGTWIETNISDLPVAVYSVAIGDADNDGLNEVVVGLDSTTNEVRMYKNASGTWIETNISDVSVNVNFVAIGDADNDNRKEVAIGTGSASYEVRVYENVSGTWVETNVSDNNSVYGLAIGDINAYGLNSIVAVGYDSSSYLIKVLDIQSNPISCGTMSAGESCYITWTVNATGAQETQYWLDANFSSSYSQVPANDSGNFQISIVTPGVYGSLNVTMISPVGNISVLKNRIFNISARVVCLGEIGANCYEVEGSAYYNSSSQYQQNPVNTTVGDKPFYVAGIYSEISRDADNTILRMHMDNTGSDSATRVYDETNRNNGTKLGDGSPAWSDGLFDSGLSFDGYDDYFNVSSIAGLNTYDKNLTIEFWFRPNTSAFADGTSILARNWDDTGNNSFWIFFWNNPGPKLHFYTTTESGINDLEGTNSNWVPGKWYHIAATFNGSRAALYINGSLDNSYNYAGGSINKSSNILIVGARNQWGGFFNGSIDELTIYNRTKNATEIAQDYISNPHSCYALTRNQACKIVWAINATGEPLTDWVSDTFFVSLSGYLDDNSTPAFKISIVPITGCGNYINCAYPNCALYRDTTTTIQSMDARQKVWSTIRTCWS